MNHIFLRASLLLAVHSVSWSNWDRFEACMSAIASATLPLRLGRPKVAPYRIKANSKRRRGEAVRREIEGVTRVFLSCLKVNHGRLVERLTRVHVSSPWIASSPCHLRSPCSLPLPVASRLRSEEVVAGAPAVRARLHPALVAAQVVCPARHLQTRARRPHR